MGWERDIDIGSDTNAFPDNLFCTSYTVVQLKAKYSPNLISSCGSLVCITECVNYQYHESHYRQIITKSLHGRERARVLCDLHIGRFKRGGLAGWLVEQVEKEREGKKKKECGKESVVGGRGGMQACPSGVASLHGAPYLFILIVFCFTRGHSTCITLDYVHEISVVVCLFFLGSGLLCARLDWITRD